LLFGEKYHRWIYILGLLLIAVGLPLGKFLIGMGLFIVGVNWLLESNRPLSIRASRFGFGSFFAGIVQDNLRPKFRLLLARRSLVVLMSIFLLHIIGTFWAADQHEAWKDVRIKIPLLLFPMVIGTTEPLEKKIFERLLLAFTLAVIISTISTALIANGIIIPKKPVNDPRDASVFVSLIRLSLMCVLSIFLIGRWMIREKNFLLKIICFITACWLVFFLLHMQSLTGLVILLAGGFIVLVCMAFIYRRKILVYTLLACFLAGGITSVFMIKKAYDEFYTIHPVDAQHLEHYTAHGHPYTHQLNHPMLENGYQVMTYISWYELDSSWNAHSRIPLNGGSDANGNPLAMTLLRYLASKGERKDAEAVNKLSNEEISAIENGATNALDEKRSPIERRLYQVIWELYHYKHGANPSGNSVTMRLELLGTALDCIRDNPWIGVGTGGQKKAFENSYKTEGTKLEDEWRHLHAHNQFLSIAVTLGIPALLYFLFVLWYAPASMRRWRSYLYLAFFFTFFLSCFDDDTLETMQGVIFYAFFNALFLYAMPRESAIRVEREASRVNESEAGNSES
jgi:hypothetical protein